VLRTDRSYFLQHLSDSTKKLSETDIFNMLEFLIHNIFVIFGGRVFQDGYKLCSSSLQLVPLFVRGRLHRGASQKENEKKLSRSFNFTFRYIDDVLSLNNSRFGDFVDRIYPTELEIKDTTYTNSSASYLYLHLEIDSEGRSKTKR
jgi:hypothetical protein